MSVLGITRADALLEPLPAELLEAEEAAERAEVLLPKNELADIPLPPLGQTYLNDWLLPFSELSMPAKACLAEPEKEFNA